MPRKRSSPASRTRAKPPSAAERPKKVAGPAKRASAVPAEDVLDVRFAEVMAAIQAPWPGAIGVSGGGDSVALMVLLREWAETKGFPAPTVLSVDHGLRPDSHKEAERVRKLAAGFGLSVHILGWKGEKPGSDVEAEARAARYALMGRWCAEHSCPALYVGHTLEDQAETFLLRLARGSGLDGLAGMQPLSAIPNPEFNRVQLVRPLLSFRRNELREFLKAKRVEWSEDPMNGDPRFARAKLRAGWPKLEAFGLSAERITAAASHLARARSALEFMTEDFLRRGARFEEEGATLDPLRLQMVPREVGLRALAALLSHVSGEEYRPRFDSLERLFDVILSGSLGGGGTLHGCIVAPAAQREQVFGSATIAIYRESRGKMKEPVAPPSRKS